MFGLRFFSSFGTRLLIPAGLVLHIVLHVHVIDKDVRGYHVWRQALTQSNVRNFYEEDRCLLNPRIDRRENTDGLHRMEFPLWQWLIAEAQRLRGEDIALTRVMSLLVGVWGLWATARWTRNLGLASAGAGVAFWAAAFSPLFYYYGANNLPDLPAWACATWGLSYTARFVNTRKTTALAPAGVFLCLGALIKLPYVVFFAPLTATATLVSARKRITVVAVATAALIPVAAWYLFAMRTWQGFEAVYQVKPDFFLWLKFAWEFFVSLLPETVVNYAALPFLTYGLFRGRRPATWKLSALAVTLYLAFELTHIATVHDYYLLVLLPITAPVVAEGFGALRRRFSKAEYWIWIPLLAMPLTAYLRMNHRWEDEHLAFNPDLLKYRTELTNAVAAGEPVLVGPDPSGAVMLYYLHKKGWVVENESDARAQYHAAKAAGVRYFFSADRRLDSLLFLKNPEKQFGTVWIYRIDVR